MTQPQGKNLSAMFDASTTGEKLNFTEEESKKFKMAFDDPEFRKMFSEYMDELQDPKHREETEQYIAQLEGEKKVPEGKELVRPSPSFVAKTHKKDTSKPGNKGDKIWINIVQSEHIQEPEQKLSSAGENWSLPYILGPPHMERDSSDANVAAFDCCFHPNAISHGNDRKQFRDLLIQTAMDGVVEAYKRQGQSVELVKTFHVIKGCHYKSGLVPAMMVPTSGKKNWAREEEKEIKDYVASVKAKTDTTTAAAAAVTTTTTLTETAATTKTASTSTKKEPAIKKGFLNSSSSSSSSSSSPKPAVAKKAPLVEEMPEGSSSKKSEVAATPPPAPSKAAVEEMPSSSSSSSSGPKEPKYKLTERGMVSWGDFERGHSNASSAPSPTATRPSELVCRIELPIVSSASQLVLDISERRLVLSYKEDYLLSLPLPYPVQDKKGGAKFDKVARTLTVIMPVQPPPAPTNVSISSGISIASSPAAAAAAETKEDESSSRGGAEEAKEQVKLAANSNSKDGLAKGHSRWVSSGQSEEEKERQAALREEVKREAKEAEERARTEAKNKPPAASVTATVSKPNSDVVVDGSSFSPSASFAGKRSGYVFKRGDLGVGYYVDSRSSPPPAAVSATTPSEVAKKTSLTTTAVASMPKIESRQTKKTVSLLVQVAGIDASSIKVDFSSSLVKVRFEAHPWKADEVSEEKESHEEAAVVYAFELAPFDNGNEWNAETSRYDVANRNMVIVLVKKNEGIWQEDASQAESETKGLIKISPYCSGEESKSITSSPASSSTSSSVQDTAALVKEMQSLTFSTTNSVLFDLD